MSYIPHLFKTMFPGYRVTDVKPWPHKNKVDIYLEPAEDKAFCCRRCGVELGAYRGKHKVKLETLPLLGLRTFVHFWRLKGECKRCRRVRAEQISFMSKESPHLTQDYAWWIGRLCEIAPVSRVAELVLKPAMTCFRLDFSRLKRMLQFYKIPDVTAISVDEVYTRKKPKYYGESRDRRFFTIICDLKTHRVIWVSESRNKVALDEFFTLIGPERSQKIEVVAMDQHEEYKHSVEEHCPQATIVWDRFHIMQNFEKVVNETRKQLHEEEGRRSGIYKSTGGKYRYMFLKKASRRTTEEKEHIDYVLERNQFFAKLEIIKERMITFFDVHSAAEAWNVLEEIGDWIAQAGYFKKLEKWHKQMLRSWDTLKNYFRYRVTTALSEGHNNVIKMLKRRAFGYKNMDYFRLKILSVCGYLNSRFIPTQNQLLTQIC